MKNVLKALRYVVVFVILIAAGFAGFSSFRFSALMDAKYPMHPELATLFQPGAKPDIELGKRIYFVRNGCVECHGPDLSGAKIMENGAMGSIHGSNITPFKTRNLKDEDMARAIRYGVHGTGRSLRFMPSFDFEGLSADDLFSLIAFIRSVPSVEKPDHANTFGPIAKTMSVLGKMPVMFPARELDHTRGFAVKPMEQPTVEFGRYLAKSCVGCHGGEFRGGPIPGGAPDWPTASNIRMGGSSGWTEVAFADTIKTGIARNTGQKLRAPMPIAALQQMNATEVQALWKYLSTLDK